VCIVQRDTGLQEFISRLPPSLQAYREIILANLVMIGEIPAPTFREQARMEFLQQRFTESGLQNVCSDEVGNGAAVLPGMEGDRNILVCAHADTPFSATTEHSLSLYPERVIGPGVADNSLGLSMIASLPMLLDFLDIRLQSNLILMGASRSLGRGDLAGLRFFLANSRVPIAAGLSVEGVQLGRLNYASQASIDAEISCRMADGAVGVTAEPHSSAVLVLNRVIRRLCDLVSPEDLILGSIEGGTAFKTPARSAALRIELQQDSNEKLTELTRCIDAIVEDIAAQTQAEVRFEIIARSNAGGLDPQHPLVAQARTIITTLGFEASHGCCSTAASCFNDQHIPGLVIGLTRGHHLNQPDEEIDIEPVFRGVAQLIGILMAIDGGCCDGH
jgi:tripeptide aminopeptidase